MAESIFTEARLRDELSKRLQLLEPGLELRAVEYSLPNRHGTSGRIDILATDRYAANVIIEIKKSNQTARQAIHELHKYIGLMKADHGLRDSQIRCVLVSTEWDELLIPFSEFSRSVQWAVDGYCLHLTDAGLPERAERIVPVTTPAELRLCREHSIYFFRDQARRDNALPALHKALHEYGLTEHLVLSLHNTKRRVSGSCNFALYLIVPEFTPDERQGARERLAQTDWVDDLDEPIRNLEEQLIVAEATASFKPYDEFEIGYPEKLTSMCATWDVNDLVRGGPRLKSKAIFSDEYLLRWAKGLEGNNAIHFELIGTPRRQLSWTEAKENARYCLEGNGSWQSLVRAYLDEIELNDPDATVTARIYNPCNLMMGLYRLAKFGTDDSLASAEIVVTSNEGHPLRIVLGAMVWNGKRVANVSEVLPGDVATLFDLFLAGAMDGGPWADEEHLITQHGLSYVLIECTASPTRMRLQQLAIKSGVLRRLEFNEQELENFGAFCAAHQDYLRSLVENIDSWARFQ
jgi:hypothetical protein